MVIFSCLSHITQLPPKGRYSFLTNSLSTLHSPLSTLHSLHEPSPSNPVVQRLLILYSLTAVDCKITFIWIPGHMNQPEHDTVDLAAKQDTLLLRITENSPFPAADFKNHFRQLTLGRSGRNKPTTNSCE